MGLRELLAARLRQSIQGCSIHQHGPIQAWVAIEEASSEDRAIAAEVAAIAAKDCAKRIDELKAAGVSDSDPRIRKEELTRAFIERLFK